MTQSTTEMSTKSYLLGGKGGSCLGLTTLPASCANYLEILEASTSWSSNGLSRTIMGQLYQLLVEDADSSIITQIENINRFK